MSEERKLPAGGGEGCREPGVELCRWRQHVGCHSTPKEAFKSTGGQRANDDEFDQGTSNSDQNAQKKQ